jgi:heme/copper-type cytochrome/quinol oxidase subunit 4
MLMLSAIAFVAMLDYVLDPSNGFFYRALAVFCFAMLQVVFKLYMNHRTEQLRKRVMAEVMEHMFKTDPPKED